MLHRKWNYILLINFLFIIGSIIATSEYYKSMKIDEYTAEDQSRLASLMTNKIETLIAEKKNATLTIALSQSKNADILEAMKSKKETQHLLKALSSELRKETDFKNIWFQIIDENGISLARSWIDKKGDNLRELRADVDSMINNPTIKTSISVGHFDMSFKAMVPLFAKDGTFIGIFEAISHFNSIASKISKDGFAVVCLVDKSYTKQIVKPFSEIFVDGHYVANKNADKKYLAMIELNTAQKYLSDHKSYVIDKDSQNIAINYTLANSDDSPMANFLIFKKLDNLDSMRVKNMIILVNLFVFLSLVVSVVIFLYLLNKENMDTFKVDEQIKYSVIFAIIAVGTMFIYYQLISYNYKNNLKQYINEHNYNIEKSYNIVYAKFKTIAMTMFELSVNTQEVADLLQNAYGTKDEKDKAREKLYNLLLDKYEFLKAQDLKQLHFHLKNNESFLRFHRPHIYGDDLTTIRETVNWVNTSNQPIDGFEEGKIFNGFRNVFPLTKYDYTNGKKYHIGSVEISFSAYAIIKEFIKNEKVRAEFIIDSDIVKSKVFKYEKNNYKKSAFKGFYIEQNIDDKLTHVTKYLDISNLSKSDIKNAHEKIKQGDIYSIVSIDKKSIYTFLPIKNSVSKEVVAAIILQVETNEINKQLENFLLQLLIGIFAIISIVLFLYREFTIKIKLKEFSSKTRKILDMQDSIVVITDTKELTDVNERFLSFFGVESGEEYFYLEDANSSWIEKINELDEKDKIVLMKDSKGVEQSFRVTVSEFASNSYIITFSNISFTIQEKLQLKKRVLEDKLTGAYNREFFHESIDSIIESSKQNKKRLALIMLDIDHFKLINDTYGHNRGDVVLVTLSENIKNSLRKDDFFIRWGGEEFMILSYVSSIKESVRIADNLRAKIEKIDFGEAGKVTCSFGAILVDTKDDMTSNIGRADGALYEAKRTGRNKVVSA